MSARTLALIVPDWLALAAAGEAELAPTAPVAVVRAGRVVSSTAQARALGVERGQRVRLARRLCPELALFGADRDREERLFSPLIDALEGVVARFTVLGPGAVGVPADSLRRTHAEEASAVEEILDRLTRDSGWEFRPGLADTVPAALLAAQHSHRVPPGETPAFLGELPIGALEVLHLLDEAIEEDALLDLLSVLRRLGITTLGALGGLTGADVGTRFGELGLRCRRLALGEDTPVLPEHLRTAELQVAAPLDPPTPRTDVLSFRARTAAAELFATVRARGLACTQVTIRLQVPSGAASTRTWRLEDMDEGRVADRARWQAEGWRASAGEAPADGEALAEDEGVALITLIAAELAPPLSTQHSLFGEDAGTGSVAHSLERLQGLFGPDAVLVPALQGGRDPGETNMWTPWQQAPQPDRDPAAPWPGAVPRPHPVRVLDTPVELLDARGRDIAARPGGLGGVPAELRVPGAGSHRIVDHSSAWPLETGWWEPGQEQYRTRLQVLAADGTAFLLCKEQGRWRLLGEYA
ncbi:DNA polymerase Y family protein [Brevibacterium album]|uniref:DNA polymerase Y family protein n=1 Tax=Brevibacterium album TaxID=417948 RepID=UPI0003FCBA08|nr:DNA polymerase Y family protein [Brevibacterium album]